MTAGWVMPRSLAMTVIAGALGGVLGWLAVDWLGSQVPESLIYPTPYLESSTVVLLALALVVVGLASGVIPARRAARIDPAISLRSL